MTKISVPSSFTPVGVLLGTLLFATLSAPFVQGQTLSQLEGKPIRRITIEGLKRVPEAQLLEELKVRPGDPFDSKIASDETGRLYRRGSFSEVSPYQVAPFEDGVWLKFFVVEKKRVRLLLFEATDTADQTISLNEKEIREKLSNQQGGLLNPYTLDLDTREILSYYREKGYHFAEAEHLIRDEGGRIDLAFRITEGPKLRIINITFKGNKTVSAKTLKSLMLTREKGFLFGWFTAGFYKPDDLERDINQIRLYYHRLGFFEALVAVNKRRFYNNNSNLDIEILIEEGVRYTLEGYEFVHNDVIHTSVIKSLVKEKPGSFFSAEAMDADKKEIEKYLKDRAYIDAEVKWEPVPKYTGTSVQVKFEIVEGPEVYVDHVHIRGNLKTLDKVIRRELEFYPGEKFNYSALEKSRSNLARLQIFSEVDYQLMPTANNSKDVVVQVVEQPTGRLIFGFGVTSGFGIIGNFALNKKNFDITDLPTSFYDIPEAFTGRGQTLNISVQPGTKRSRYQFQFTEPYLFESRNSLTLAASAITIIRRDFDERRLSFTPSLGTAFDFDRDLIFSIGARLEEVTIDEIDFTSAPDVFEAEGSTSIVALNTTLVYDKVLQEPLEGPYDGHLERITYEFGGDPLGGHIDFHKVQASIELFFPLYTHEEGNLHHVIAVNSKMGLIEHRGDTTKIPIFERFFLGGPNTVRGFRFRGLGPHYFGDALGGTAAWYGNVEYIFPLFQKILRGVLFFDYGNLETDLQAFDLDKMRYTVGAGVRINFPFLGTPLPVGLYLGDAIKHEDFDRTRFFLFTIGAPF